MEQHNTCAVVSGTQGPHTHLSPAPPDQGHIQTKHEEDPLEESNPSSLWRKSQELVFRGCCPVGLVLKAASVRAGIGIPMEPSHLKKTCCVALMVIPTSQWPGAPAELLLLARQLS